MKPIFSNMVTIKNNTSNAFVSRVINLDNMSLLIVLNPDETLVYRIDDDGKKLLSPTPSHAANAA